MDFPTLFLGTAMTLVPLAAAGLLAALVILERPSRRMSAVAAGAPRDGAPSSLPLRERGSARAKPDGRRKRA